MIPKTYRRKKYTAFEDTRRRIQASKRNLILFLICLIVSIVIIIRPVNLTFHAIAETEAVDIVYCGQGMLHWDLNAVDVQTSDEQKEVFTGTIVFRQTGKILISFDRISHGYLEVLLRYDEKTSNDTIAFLFRDTNAGPKPDLILVGKALLTFPYTRNDDNGQVPIVIPILGNISVGREPTFGAMVKNTRLFSGNICMRSHSLFSKELYNAGESELQFGDWFSTGYADSCRKSSGSFTGQGLLTITDRPGICVMVDFIADELEVHRYKAQGYSLRTSLWTRLSKDTFLQGVWVVFFALWGFGRFMMKRREHGR